MRDEANRALELARGLVTSTLAEDFKGCQAISEAAREEGVLDQVTIVLAGMAAGFVTAMATEARMDPVEAWRQVISKSFEVMGPHGA